MAAAVQLTKPGLPWGFLSKSFPKSQGFMKDREVGYVTGFVQMPYTGCTLTCLIQAPYRHWLDIDSSSVVRNFIWKRIDRYFSQVTITNRYR